MSAIDKIQTAQIANLYGIINSGAIPVYPPANDIVTITGNQTITGDKVFTGTVNAPTVDVLDDSTSVATTEWVKDYVPTITGGFVTASANNVFTGINSFVNPITPTITTFDGIDMSGNDILQVDNIDLVTINGSAYPPVVIDPSLNTVLTAGHTATNSIILDNSGTGTNLISLLPNFSANNPHITLTDGTTTNTIDKNGYTTRNSVQNSTHFLNFSDASTTGVGSIQKTSGIECNPSTKTITATTFVGDLSGNATTATTATNATNVDITNDNTSSTFYPVFVSDNSGNLPLKVDKTTTPLSYVPSTGTLTTQVFAGALSGGINASLINPATTTTTYPCIFTATTGGFPLTSNGLTYIPNTNALTATTFVGDLSGNATTATTASGATDITITDSTATAGTFYPTFVNSAGTNKSVRIDTTGLTYSPSTDTLTTTNFNGTATHATDITITDSTATAGTFYPTFVNTAGTQKSVRVDTTGLTYSPSTDTLTTTNFAGTATRATNIAGGLGGSIPYQTAVNATSLLANGTAGQVLQSNGTTLAPSWVTPSSGSATTIAITQTSAPTAGTYYPTFVSASGSGQTLRADITGGTSGLSYTPSSNLLSLTDGGDTTNIYPYLIDTVTIQGQSLIASTLCQITFIADFFSSGISFKKILTFDAGTGVKENSIINSTTTGTTTLTTSDAFKTIINTPTAGTRIFVLPAPTAGTVGYWYAICNKSTSFTIAVQQPAGTTIAVVAVAPITGAGSSVKVAVTAGGASYFSPSQ